MHVLVAVALVVAGLVLGLEGTVLMEPGPMAEWWAVVGLSCAILGTALALA